MLLVRLESREAKVSLIISPAVAAHLAKYKFTLKTDPPSSFRPGATDAPAENLSFEPLEPSKDWDEGRLYAEAQNFARTLQELPANMMTPTAFCERVQAEFANIPGVTVVVRDEGQSFVLHDMDM